MGVSWDTAPPPCTPCRTGLPLGAIYFHITWRHDHNPASLVQCPDTSQPPCLGQLSICPRQPRKTLFAEEVDLALLAGRGEVQRLGARDAAVRERCEIWQARACVCPVDCSLVIGHWGRCVRAPLACSSLPDNKFRYKQRQSSLPLPLPLPASLHPVCPAATWRLSMRASHRFLLKQNATQGSSSLESRAFGCWVMEPAPGQTAKVAHAHRKRACLGRTPTPPTPRAPHLFCRS